MDADDEEIIHQRLERNGPGGQLFRADDWRECYGEDVAYLLDQLAQERRARHYAEQIAVDLYRDLTERQEAVVAAAEERERARKTLSTLVWPRDSRNWHDVLLELLFPDNPSPPPAGALAARLAEALAALEPFAALADASGNIPDVPDNRPVFVMVVGTPEPPPQPPTPAHLGDCRRARAVLARHKEERT